MSENTMQELDLYIRNAAFIYELSDEALELWEMIRDNYKAGVK